MKVDDLVKDRKNQKKYDAIFLHIDSYYNEAYSYFNMGLLYMATILKEKGYEVSCLGIRELLHMSRADLQRTFMHSKPAIAAFYTLSDNIYQVEEYAELIKIWSPKTMIVVGGPLATSLGKEIMNCKNFDIAVMGEGERVMEKLMELKKNGTGSLEEIKGIIYRKNGELAENPPEAPIEDLDSLPFPDQDLVGGRRTFHIVSGRGCPYNCLFCFQGVHGLKYRFRSAKNVAEEVIKNLENPACVNFDIIDDTFVTDPARVREFSQILQEYRERTKRRFIFFCQGRVDIIEKHPEMLTDLQKVGMARIQMGLESGDEDMLKAYRKRITPKQVRNVCQKVKDTGGIVMVGNFILGGPHETEKSFQASLDLAKDLITIAPGMCEVAMSYMGPLPGSPIKKNPESFGLKIYEDSYKKGISLSDVHITSETLDANHMRILKNSFNDQVCLHMKSLVPKIPQDTIISHIKLARDFYLNSYWYLLFFQGNQILNDYYNFLMTPRFSPLVRIDRRELLQWHPLRVMEKRNYTPDGKSIILPESNLCYTLEDPNEILVYELSAGKLNVSRMLDEFIAETGTEATRQEVLEKIFIPTFEKLEKSFHIIFYK